MAGLLFPAAFSAPSASDALRSRPRIRQEGHAQTCSRNNCVSGINPIFSRIISFSCLRTTIGKFQSRDNEVHMLVRVHMRDRSHAPAPFFSAAYRNIQKLSTAIDRGFVPAFSWTVARTVHAVTPFPADCCKVSTSMSTSSKEFIGVDSTFCRKRRDPFCAWIERVPVSQLWPTQPLMQTLSPRSSHV